MHTLINNYSYTLQTFSLIGINTSIVNAEVTSKI